MIHASYKYITFFLLFFYTPYHWINKTKVHNK